MDASKIEKELNWTPEHPFEEWIDETIEWYQKNQEWVKSSLKKS
jgi:dTDP-glucose 4,6-dehydratase